MAYRSTVGVHLWVSGIVSQGERTQHQFIHHRVHSTTRFWKKKGADYRLLILLYISLHTDALQALFFF
jgi:hypothetical protein